MQLLYCDESNLQEVAGDFLIYGGLSIDDTRAKSLSQTIEEIRSKAKIDRSFALKFNPGPADFTNEQFIAVKQAVVEAAIAHDAKLIAYLILHDIATNPDEARRYGINTVCYHFDCILQRAGTFGIVLIDRFNDAGNKIGAHLTEKFSVGVRGMPFSEEMRLNNILGFHYSAVGQSHFPSIIDIVLGSLRFSINAHTKKNKQHADTAKKMLGIISPLFYRDKPESPIPELGFVFRPKTVQVEQYRAQYQSLRDFLASAGVEIAQVISVEKQ